MSTGNTLLTLTVTGSSPAGKTKCRIVGFFAVKLSPLLLSSTLVGGSWANCGGREKP
jgi:hypothetical protein